MQYILIVGINKISVKYISDAIRHAGHDLILSIDKSALCGDALQAISDVQCIPLFSDHNALSDYLNAHPDVTQNIHSITTFFDELFPMVNKIAEEFNFRGPPSVFAELASKYAVGKIVPEHVPEEVQISFSEEKFVLPWLKVRENNTIILKPAIGSGALATSTLHIEADQDPTHAIKSAILASGAKSCETLPWIIQAYCSGTLVSMEGFVQGGKTIYLGMSRRERVRFTEVANHFPNDCGIEPIVHAKIQAAIHDLVLRSGFDNGFFHCEFIATYTTAYLIDANMGRLGGATIVEQVALAYGFPPSSVLQHAALLPLGLAESIPAYDQTAQINNTLSYWYGLAEESVIRGWDVPAISSIHTPIASPGSRIQPVGVSDYSWVGMLTGYTDIVQQEINLIRVKTDHGDRVPVFK